MAPARLPRLWYGGVEVGAGEVVGVVEVLGDEAADADLAEVVEELADLLGGAVERMSHLAWDLGDGPERPGYAASSCPAG